MFQERAFKRRDSRDVEKEKAMTNHPLNLSDSKRASLDPVEIAVNLDRDLQRSLAALQEVPGAVAELALTAYGFGTRSLLKGMELIVTNSESGRLVITGLGWKVIFACAERRPRQISGVESAGEYRRAIPLA
jgi:hypothetical protein